MNPVARHRRDVWLAIVLPISLVTGAILLVILGLLTLTLTGVWETRQVATIANILGIVCFLLPTAIIVILINVLLAVILRGNDRAISSTIPLLRQLRQKIETITSWVPPLAERLVQPLIGVETHLTRWEQLIIRMVKKEP